MYVFIYKNILCFYKEAILCSTKTITIELVLKAVDWPDCLLSVSLPLPRVVRSQITCYLPPNLKFQIVFSRTHPLSFDDEF